jgi:signal transduction histidine kinase
VKQPLSLIGSIKTKFAIVILAAIGTAVVTSQVGYAFGWPIWLRPIVAAALSLIAVYFFARGLTRPLRDMAAASLSIARGNYDQRVHTASVDEVGQLAQAFNSMAADLAVVERNRKELVANVSHELRTPIAGLRATLENIADGVAEPTPDLINAMLGRVGRLQRLVTDLLDLSRLEAGTAPLHREPVHLASLVAAAADDCRRDHPTAVVSSSVDHDTFVHADPERLHQVLANLLDNGVRHGGAVVDVSCHRAAVNEITIVVADNGPGLAPADSEHAFDRFYRAADRRDDDGGTGLGLAIVQWIVDLHGGRITIERNEPTGARFVVCLPERPDENLHTEY